MAIGLEPNRFGGDMGCNPNLPSATREPCGLVLKEGRVWWFGEMEGSNPREPLAQIPQSKPPSRGLLRIGGGVPGRFPIDPQEPGVQTHPNQYSLVSPRKDTTGDW